ncbi:MAG: UDP-glucose/GDP-mannose dehydrogenase family protein [Bacteroidia bacterium]
MKVTVVGTGYVGLVSGTCFAEMGNEVICVDNNPDKVKKLRNGEMVIYEPGLDVVFERNIQQERLSFTGSLDDGIKDADIIFLALPTPPGEDGSADLKYVLGVADELGKILDKYTVVVDKSTVPVGTADKVHAAIAKHAKVEFDVVSNPEFLREGVAVDDFLKPERVVIGTSSERARGVMEKLYRPFVRQGNPIIFMDERSAELTKYAANSFLATKITFMNEIANLCEIVGADVDSVRRGIGTDSRIGKRFLFAGTGYGGSCFPKDVQALAKTSEENNFDFRILKSVMEVNHDQKTVLLPKIENHFKGDLKGKTFAVWGLAFKPNTDDIREAPAIYLMEELLQKGAAVKAFDPEAIDNMKDIFGDRVEFGENQYDILEGADALIIMTEWTVFRVPQFGKVAKALNNKVIFDGRNLYDLEEMEALGFTYHSIGRKVIV